MTDAFGRRSQRFPFGSSAAPEAGDLVRIVVGKPDLSVGADGDARRVALTRRNRVFRQRAGRREPAQGIAFFREPKGAVGAGYDGIRCPARCKFGDDAVRRQASELWNVAIRKPYRAIWSGDEPPRIAITGKRVLRDVARGRDSADFTERRLGNQSAPSGPVVMARALESPGGSAYML